MGPLAGRAWFPLWGLMRHNGRRSGRAYATPVALRPTEDGFVIPLPFGASTEWVRNILAAHGGGLRWSGREFALSDPVVLERAEALPAFSAPLRVGVRLLGIEQFLQVGRKPA
jgi:deazaflavin-dependent oxidoreductase (nitroreductase family)